MDGDERTKRIDGEVGDGLKSVDAGQRYEYEVCERLDRQRLLQEPDGGLRRQRNADGELPPEKTTLSTQTAFAGS